MDYSEEIIKLKKMCEEYNIDFVGNTINDIKEIDRQTMEKLVFLVSTRLSNLTSRYTTLRNSMIDGYEEKDKLIELRNEISSFLRVKNERGLGVIADSFDKIKNTISLQSDGKLAEQLRSTIKLYDILEKVKKYEKKYNVYSNLIKCIQSCIKSISFANDNPDMFENDKLLKLNEIKEKIIAFMQNEEIEVLDTENKIIIDADLIKRLEAIDLKPLEICLDEYDYIATDIWKGYLNNPKEGNKGLHYLVHSGLIYGKKYNKHTISTSLITEKHMRTAGGNYNCGMIIVPNDIVGAESYDIGSNNYSNFGASLYLEGGRNIIKLPQLVEAETIKSGEYSEVNSRNFEIAGVYSIVNPQGKDYVSRQYKEGKKIAQKLKIPFVEIDEITKTQKIILPEQKLLDSVICIGKKLARKLKFIYGNRASGIRSTNNDNPITSSGECNMVENGEEILTKPMSLAEEIATSGRGYNSVISSSHNRTSISKKSRDCSIDR